ncbi:Uncharacterised protein [Mobiluncus curtisii subsp. curtisii]|nr:Uncharacterised protein [Mobiluncus curtisii subsp. curtisii]
MSIDTRYFPIPRTSYELDSYGKEGIKPIPIQKIGFQ